MPSLTCGSCFRRVAVSADNPSPKCPFCFSSVRFLDAKDAPPPARPGGRRQRARPKPPVRDEEDDEEDDGEEQDNRRAERGPRRQGYRCPICDSRLTPVYVSKISSAGWVLFFTTIWFCGIGLVGLFMRENVRLCPECGGRIGGKVAG